MIDGWRTLPSGAATSRPWRPALPPRAGSPWPGRASATPAPPRPRTGRGLAAAHEAGLVHRDFKPENVLVGRDGRVQVTDFGLVRDAEAREDSSDGHASPPVTSDDLTRTGTIIGTPIYMSPEQHEGLPVGARSDQFSFCVALYEALEGTPAFAGGKLEELRAAVLHGDPRPAE